jgi:hypothetical protein
MYIFNKAAGKSFDITLKFAQRNSYVKSLYRIRNIVLQQNDLLNKKRCYIRRKNGVMSYTPENADVTHTPENADVTHTPENADV